MNMMHDIRALIAKHVASFTLDRRKQELYKRVWNPLEKRVDVSSFESSVPTLIINASQEILDANLSFRLIFGELMAIDQKPKISEWYKHLTNFKAIPKRSDQLNG